MSTILAGWPIARRVIASLAFSAIMWAPALAGEASAWDGDSHAAARLIAGTTAMGSAVVRAGIAIRLAPGWKTYWRIPGDSGVPPRFNFARSQNVRSVKVLWPAPHSFSDETGNSIGYKDGVILPLQITPEDVHQPVTLRLDLDYAVCEKLCIPAEAKIELELAEGSSAHDAELTQSEGLVPKPVKVGAVEPLTVKAVTVEPGPAPQRVVVDIASSNPAPVHVFAEGPSPDWALPVPQPVADGPAGIKRFAFNLEGNPPGSGTAGAILTFTVVTDKAAIEASTRLD